MKQTFETFTRILGRSKEYEIEGQTILVLRDYYSGDTVRFDLSRLTPEMFEEIIERDPKEAIWADCKENIDSWEERTGAALDAIDHNRCSFEQADYRLYYEIQERIEEYCHDHDLDCEDIDPDDILFYVDD